MNWLVVFGVVFFVLFFASFFVFQNEWAVLIVTLTKTKNVSFWSSVAEKPVWLSSSLRFVGLPPECFNNGYNAYHDAVSFQDTPYCADVVCSNGSLVITSTNSSECANPSFNKCSFGLLDKSTMLCVMNSCTTDSDCASYQSVYCVPVCKSFGKGIYFPSNNSIIPATKVCSCQ